MRSADRSLRFPAKDSSFLVEPLFKPVQRPENRPLTEIGR